MKQMAENTWWAELHYNVAPLDYSMGQRPSSIMMGLTFSKSKPLLSPNTLSYSKCVNYYSNM